MTKNEEKSLMAFKGTFVGLVHVEEALCSKKYNLLIEIKLKYAKISNVLNQCLNHYLS